MTTETDHSVGVRIGAELTGTAFLLAAIVGSGEMAQSLTDDVGLQLLQNAITVGAALAALITTLGAVSGAHFNPAVTAMNLMLGRIDRRTAAGYVAAQVAGAIVGTVGTNAMFGRSALELSTTDRGDPRLVGAEVVATFGLLAVVFISAHVHPLPVVAATVAGYVTAAFAFTASTCFANPAVTIGRAFTDSFAGIDPAGVPAFVAAELLAIPIALVAARPIVRPAADRRAAAASAP